MAEIRNLENRDDIIFSAEGGPIWIKFRRLVQHYMSIAVIWSRFKTRCTIPIWRTFEWISWHVIPEPAATLQGAVTWLNQCHDRATLQGVMIPSAILKSFFAIFFFVF